MLILLIQKCKDLFLEKTKLDTRIGPIAKPIDETYFFIYCFVDKPRKSEGIDISCWKKLYSGFYNTGVKLDKYMASMV